MSWGSCAQINEISVANIVNGHQKAVSGEHMGQRGSAAASLLEVFLLLSPVGPESTSQTLFLLVLRLL